MVEGARLESVYTVKAVSRVQIPSSPPCRFPFHSVCFLFIAVSLFSLLLSVYSSHYCCFVNKVCLYIFHLRAQDFLWLRNDSQHKSGGDSAVKKFRKHSAIFTYAWKRRRLEYGGNAPPEKALCDKLYTMPPVTSQREIERMLFEDLRIGSEEFERLSTDSILQIGDRYRSNNLKYLMKYLRRNMR